MQNITFVLKSIHEWWTCAQATRVQSPSAEYFFPLKCFYISYFIFEMMNFTNFRLNFTKITIIAPFTISICLMELQRRVKWNF